MRTLPVYLCGLILACSVVGVAASPPPVPLPAAARALASVPAWFEPNLGLLDSRVKYLSRGEGYTLLLEDSGAWLALAEGASARKVHLTLAGSRQTTSIEPVDRLPGRTDYILGNRPARWKSGVPQYARVRYREVYPGIDVVYRGSDSRIEYDFVVSPGADPSRIRVRFGGADSLRLDGDGSLVMTAGRSELRQPRPVIYQETSRGRVFVQGDYLLARNREVRFRLGSYDRTKPLIIDPVLVYAGYFGGSTYDVVTGAACDPDGSIWLTGTTLSVIEFPEQNEPYQSAMAGTRDVFLAKLRVPSSGAPTLLYFTYLGGSALESGGQIVVDKSGMVYVTGTTWSTDFPKSANAFSTQLGGASNTAATSNQDAFVAKINPAAAAGSESLVFSSYLGGIDMDVPTALALDNTGKVLVAGYTASIDIDPIVSPTLQPNNRGGWDGFFYKIDADGATGATLLFNTYFGGKSTDVITGVAADDAGAIYLAGYTFSDDLPIAGDAYQAALSGASNLFVAKLDLTKSGLDTLVYGSYLGGTGLDLAEAMQIDAKGNLWLTGYTLSQDFPATANAYQPVHNGGSADVFLTQVAPSRPPAEFIQYSTFLGGSGADIAYDLALVGNGKVALTGYTFSKDFPVMAAPGSGLTRKLMADAFVGVLDPSVPGVGALVFSTYFGGVNQDVGVKLAVDAAGNFFVAGTTLSKNLPVTDGSGKPSPSGSTSGFLLKVDKLPGE